MNEKVIVRFPPSPTGYLHIGGVRTMLFNYLFSAGQGGKMIFRFEDTDTERSKKEYEDDILDIMSWLKIPYELPDIMRQTERKHIYQKHFENLVSNNLAYEAEESNDGSGKKVVRFKNPNKVIAFQDLIRGEVTFDTTELGDFVIAKSITDPLYHLAVVIDDHEMGVTHVIRGEEHISNTPRQILVLEALGFNRPTYAHLPLIVDTDRKKLSKRVHGEKVWARYYRDKGILPQALINYVALLGWNPGTEKEIFTLEELVKEFNLTKVHKSSAAFDEKKLDWVNKEHIKLLPPEEQKKLILKSIENEPYMTDDPVLDPTKLVWKKATKEETFTYLEEAEKLIASDGDLMAYAEKVGKGNVLWPVRYALTGADASPDPFTILEILGKEKSLTRIKNAIMALRQ